VGLSWAAGWRLATPAPQALYTEVVFGSHPRGHRAGALSLSIKGGWRQLLAPGFVRANFGCHDEYVTLCCIRVIVRARLIMRV